MYFKKFMVEVPSDVLREDIVDFPDFIERLKNEEDQTVLDTDQIKKLTFLSACLQLYHYISDDSNAEMSCISYEVHDMVQSLFHHCGDDMLVKLKDHIVPRLYENINSSIISDHHSESSATLIEDQLVELLDAFIMNLHYLPKVRTDLILPSIIQYELLQNVFGNLRDFHGLKVNGYIEHKTIEYILPQFQLMAGRVGHFWLVLLSYQLDNKDEEDENEASSKINSILVNLLLYIIPVSLEVMHMCSTNLEASKSAKVGCFIMKLLEASPDILGEYLIHLQQHMVNTITPSTSARHIHIMIEFLLIILTDVPKDFIHYEKLFVLLARVGALIREVSVLVHNLEDNTKEINGASLNLLENIELLRKDLKNVFLKAASNSSQLCFPMSFEEETEWIIRKLTSGPTEINVIFIVGMPGIGKTTLAYRVYNGMSVVGHFDIRAWCTVNQDPNEKKQEESLELIEKSVFGEEHCPDELKYIGEKIARKCDGLPLVLDLIGEVISRKKKKKVSWIEVLNNLEFFILYDKEEVMKVIQLSYGHLSDQLKPCFWYLASYSKDKDIMISELKDLWSDEGLLEPTDLKSVEEVMEALLVHLRCLIIPTVVEAEALPPSFSNLCNLETLKVITDESFPMLEELYIKCCDKIIEIPENFGDIASLKLIKVYGSPQLKESALKIKEYVEEMTGEDKLEVEIGS
ncbi:hypothetical protein BC332_14028 [Capsicum chinense]|nr:hypothetical protein BC332_14028 [Capsicum chinense]